MTPAQGRAMWEKAVADLWAAVGADDPVLLAAARRLRDVEIFLIFDQSITVPTNMLPPGVAAFRARMLAHVGVEVLP
jgi:hypothetical protein